MEFETQGVAYYAAIFIVGCAGGLFRQWRDGKRYSFRRSAGGILSGGLFAFGCIGIWLGHDPGSSRGLAYFMAVSVFIGFYSLEVQDAAQGSIKSIVEGLLRLIGVEIKNNDDH